MSYLTFYKISYDYYNRDRLLIICFCASLFLWHNLATTGPLGIAAAPYCVISPGLHRGAFALHQGNQYLRSEKQPLSSQETSTRRRDRPVVNDINIHWVGDELAHPFDDCVMMDTLQYM